MTLTKKQYEVKKQAFMVPSGFDVVGALIAEYKTSGKQAANDLLHAFGVHEKRRSFEVAHIIGAFQKTCKEQGIAL